MLSTKDLIFLISTSSFPYLTNLFCKFLVLTAFGPGKISEGSKQILLEAQSKGKAYGHCCVGMVESPHVQIMVGMVEACAKVSDIMIICMCVRWGEVKFMATTDRCVDEDTWCLKFLGFESGENGILTRYKFQLQFMSEGLGYAHHQTCLPWI